jgi:hypothetical protein
VQEGGGIQLGKSDRKADKEQSAVAGATRAEEEVRP